MWDYNSGRVWKTDLGAVVGSVFHIWGSGGISLSHKVSRGVFHSRCFSFLIYFFYIFKMFYLFSLQLELTHLFCNLSVLQNKGVVIITA